MTDEPKKKQEPNNTTSWGTYDPDIRDEIKEAKVPRKRNDPNEIIK